MPHPDDSVPDPYIDTPLLDRWSEADMPLRGSFRENLAKRVRNNVKQRRTEDAISQRLSQNAVSPIMSALELELSDRVKERIQENHIDE